MILPSATDSWLVFHAGRAHYDRLLEGGVKLYERQDVLLHAKTALIDGVWSTVGSTNLDWRSFLHNQEVNVVVLGPEFGRRMRASFERDLAASRQITLASMAAPPDRRQGQGAVRENVGILAVAGGCRRPPAQGDEMHRGREFESRPVPWRCRAVLSPG